MKQAQWIDRFQDAWCLLGNAVDDMTGPPKRGSLSPAKARKLYDDATGTINYLLAHPPDDGAPDAADGSPTAAPAAPAAAHRREAKRTLLRFFNVCLPSYATEEEADEIESIVDHIVDATVLELQRAKAPARIKATPLPT